MSNVTSLIPSFWQLVLLLIIAAIVSILVVIIIRVRGGTEVRKEDQSSSANEESEETSLMTGELQTSEQDIKFLREEYLFSYKNIRIAEARHRIVLYRTKETEYLVYITEEYRPGLKAESSDGKNLQILPVWELPKFLNKGVERENQKVNTADVITQFSSLLNIAREEVYKAIAIILFPERTKSNDVDGYYEEILVSWLDKRSLPIKGVNSERVTFVARGRASSYVDIQLAEKYEFHSNPNPEIVGNNKIEKDKDYELILDDSRHYIFRFRRGLEGKGVINFRIGVITMLKSWIWLGLLMGIGTMPFSLFIILTGRPFSQVSPILLGTLATLVGFRVLLFEDIDLLKRWSWYYLILIIINTIILIYAGITIDNIQ